MLLIVYLAHKGASSLPDHAIHVLRIHNEGGETQVYFSTAEDTGAADARSRGGESAKVKLTPQNQGVNSGVRAITCAAKAWLQSRRLAVYCKEFEAKDISE